MTNFDFLKKESQFDGFSDVAIAAERILMIDASSSIINCRRAMEFAVKWMYSVDRSLIKPWDDKLVSLLSTEEFRDIVGEDLWKRLDFIRKIGNLTAHAGKKVTKDQAIVCLENLFVFMDFVAYCYGHDYQEGAFDPSLLEKEIKAESALEQADEIGKTAKFSFEGKEIDLEALIKENTALKAELTTRREEQKQTYVPKPLDISEYKTRKIYIDTMLEDAGWIEGKNWLNEVKISGMPNKSQTGYADYVLYGDDGRVLAVIEAKKTCVDVSKGRQQAMLYADLIQKQQGRRPVIFLTNGFETRILDGKYPERRVAAFYSKRDLEKFFNLQAMKTDLSNVQIEKEIAGRYYQEGAIKAVCDRFCRENRRKALLVMATGSGKTRTVIALVDVLLRYGWIKNVLFLADRTSLVTQAKRSFVNLLPDLSVTNLCEEKENYQAHCVFSTYQTMMNCIDDVHDKEGKLFTCGHFDLVICDEAHRSIYNKYRDIFKYFDAPLVGLTATPKDEIDKNTYEIFELQNGIPTYGYELAQAVKDGYLVDFMSVETTLKFMKEGISYDELSDEDKAIYEATFEDSEKKIPDRIVPSALNDWIFNEDTIRKALNILMTNGLRVDYGNKIGKTIIFARNHKHAEKILEVFGKEYPHLGSDFAKVIDNHIKYAQSAIDEFSDPKKMPQIAISVDMLDTGIDVPEVLNLVFFKRVMSKAKFWQMIGRGTRLCPGVLDGKDKEKFYIFDFCNNFDFFRVNGKGRPAPNTVAVQSAIFNLQFEMVFKLQELKHQTARLNAYRDALVTAMSEKVQKLNRENFAVRQHLKYVDRYSLRENYQTLTYANTLEVREELAPLIEPEKDDAKALRFDALIYGIELAILAGKSWGRSRHDLIQKVTGIAGVANIPEISAQKDWIEKILHTDYLSSVTVEELEEIRKRLRDLIKYIPTEKMHYETNFTDEILSVNWNKSELENDDLKDYKAKAEYYVRNHLDQEAIKKLKENVPLTKADIDELEEILWSEIGTREDYEAEYGQKPLGEFVREIVGLDMTASKQAFAQYLDETNLDSRQIYFVNQIVEFIVCNGMMKDLSVLQESPFTDQGSIIELFSDDLSVWMGIRSVIDQINENAFVA